RGHSRLMALRTPGGSSLRAPWGILFVSRDSGSRGDTDGQTMATPGRVDGRTDRSVARVADPVDDLHHLRDDAPLSVRPGCGGGRAEAASVGWVLRAPGLADRRRE